MTIRIFTIKEMIPHIVKGQRNNLTLYKDSVFKIDKEFFKTFKEQKVPYIHLCTISDFLKHMVIDPVNKAFIRYSEDVESNYGWQINYNEFSFSYQLVLANKQNQELYNTFAYFNPFLFDCIINDNFEILPLGAVNMEEPLI